MRPSPYLACVPCVQEMASYERELVEPSLSSERKQILQEQVHEGGTLMNQYKQRILDIEILLKEREFALGQLECK